MLHLTLTMIACSLPADLFKVNTFLVHVDVNVVVLYIYVYTCRCVYSMLCGKATYMYDCWFAQLNTANI